MNINSKHSNSNFAHSFDLYFLNKISNIINLLFLFGMSADVNSHSMPIRMINEINLVSKISLGMFTAIIHLF